MILENLQPLIELLVVMGGLVVCVKIYTSAETEKQLEKTRMYTERDIRTANIEASVERNGFNEPQDQGIEGLVSMALANPQVLQSLFKGGGQGTMPQTFPGQDPNLANKTSDKIKQEIK